MDTIEQVRMKCAELEQALQTEDPRFKVVLKDLHEGIRKTPELLYALGDDQIALVVAGLSKFTGVEITTAKTSAKITKKVAGKLTEDDV
jgi:hypothetical protein